MGINLNKALVLSHREWNQIYAKIRQDYADQSSVYLIRDKMRNEMGFRHREHYVNNLRSEIHLDFYDESARTMFLLRYMNRD